MATKNKNNHNTQKGSKSEDHQDYSSLVVVLFYCSLIVFFPVVTFFVLKSFVLDSLFTLSEMKTNIYSAVGAVIALHAALGIYIYRAYFGGQKSQAKID